jgi:hypothetical protein
METEIHEVNGFHPLTLDPAGNLVIKYDAGPTKLVVIRLDEALINDFALEVTGLALGVHR